MPKLIALPDGSTGSFPDDMDDGAITAVLRKQFPADDNYSNEGRGSVAPFAAKSTTEKVIEGARGALRRIATPMVPTADGGMFGGVNPSAMKAENAYYNANKDELGVPGMVGDMGAEVAVSAAPVAKVGNALSRLVASRAGRLAPAVGDIAANAGYAAATAEDGQRGTAAALGGAGAAGGRLIGRIAGGMKPLMSKGAQALLDAGVQPTPGQMFGDGVVGSTLRATEDKAMSIPLAGDILRNARKRSMEQYGRAEVNAALKPLGATAKGSGEDMIESAQRAVSEAYDLALPQTFLTPAKAGQALQATQAAMKDIPLLTTEQEGKLIQYVARKIQPQLQTGQNIDGKTWKAIDAEIGHYAREYSTAADPSMHSLGDAFYTLQQSWRDGLEATTPQAMSLLKSANSTYRQLLPSVKAADRAMAQGGVFTPLQFNRAARKFGQDGNDLNTAARRVLPASIPDSGTAGRALLGMGALGVGAGTGTLAHTAAASAIAAAVYSPWGINFMVNGLRGAIPDSVAHALRRLPPERAAHAIDELVKQNPDLGPMVQSLGSQLAREAVTRQQQEVE